MTTYRIYEQTDTCWLWTGRLDRGGYGRVGRSQLAHKVAYEEVNGPVPDGLELDHLCRNHACVNPDHLEAVTHQENVRRGVGGINNAIKTHCPQDHSYSGDNLRIDLQGKRRCRTCKRLETRRRRCNGY